LFSLFPTFPYTIQIYPSSAEMRFFSFEFPACNPYLDFYPAPRALPPSQNLTTFPPWEDHLGGANVLFGFFFLLPFSSPASIFFAYQDYVFSRISCPFFPFFGVNSFKAFCFMMRDFLVEWRGERDACPP